MYQLILMYLHTIVWYYNISSKVNFQVAGLKVKIRNWLFLEKNFVIALAPTFTNGF